MLDDPSDDPLLDDPLLDDPLLDDPLLDDPPVLIHLRIFEVMDAYTKIFNPYIYIYPVMYNEKARARERARPGAIAVRGIRQTRFDSVAQSRPGGRRELLDWAYI